MIASYEPYQLEFKKPARTSRGEMRSHQIYLIKLEHNGRWALGEAAPLPGLSIDAVDTIEQHIATYCSLINEGISIHELELDAYPSVAFALECALQGLSQPTAFTYFDTPFTQGKPIPINGLVWMDSIDEMYKQAIQKIEEGYTCIKLKVGALDFDSECRLLENIRKVANAFRIEIRLDANGAFLPDEALTQLRELSRFGIHSIEQPIKPKQHDVMQEICAKSPIAIALDEELIGVNVHEKGNALLRHIRPQYIILKPTLIGGLRNAEQWIRLAQEFNIGWWATSALESNIGLNAIAQWTATQHTTLPKGLGTGSLYTNNFPSPLIAQAGFLTYDTQRAWKLNQLSLFNAH